MSIEEMEETLRSLGIEVIGNRGWEVQAACPAHEERTGHIDHNPSWYINSDSGAHICFSCGFKGNFQSLVSYIKGTPISQSTDWTSGELNLVERMMKASQPETRKEEPLVIVTESMLSAFVDVPDDALASRGITRKAATAHGLRWNRYKSNWIIPVRDLNGVLLGWQEKGYSTRYFNNYPKGMKKGKSLFGYSLYTSGDLIVLESPLDVVRLTSLDITCGVATYGCTISTEQFNAIRGADRVIFALDNDPAGKAASKEMLERSQTMHTDSWFFNYDGIDVKDVGGMSRREIEFGLEKANHMINGEKVIK